jgi:hypothetical protein
MNKNELMAKIEAMKAKKAQEMQQVEEPATQEETAQEMPPEKSKLVSFQIIWSEATSKHDGQEVYTWERANELMKELVKNITLTHNEGYYKTKVRLIWENGEEIIDRLDLSLNEGDFNPFKQTIQDYLKPQTGVMYDSNLMQGDRDTLLSWSDEDENTTTEPTAPPPTEPNEETKPINLTLEVTEVNNLTTIPDTLKKLLGITETIEESNDRSETALLKASEQVETARAYIVYLQSILPILEAKVSAMIEAKHKPAPIKINNFTNYQDN